MPTFHQPPLDEIGELRYALAMVALELQAHRPESAFWIAFQALQFGASPSRLAAMNPLLAVAAMSADEATQNAIVNGPRNTRPSLQPA